MWSLRSVCCPSRWEEQGFEPSEKVLSLCLCACHPIALEGGWGRSGLVHGDGVDPFEIRVVGGDGKNLEIRHGLQGERII